MNYTHESEPFLCLNYLIFQRPLFPTTLNLNPRFSQLQKYYLTLEWILIFQRLLRKPTLKTGKLSKDCFCQQSWILHKYWNILIQIEILEYFNISQIFQKQVISSYKPQVWGTLINYNTAATSKDLCFFKWKSDSHFSKKYLILCKRKLGQKLTIIWGSYKIRNFREEEKTEISFMSSSLCPSSLPHERCLLKDSHKN